ncbi:unnamed protein product [Calypogeia fissa]
MMAEADVEFALMTIQSQEYARASMMYSDLEFACQLQLNEALAASAAMSHEAEGVRREQLDTNAGETNLEGGEKGGRRETGRGGERREGDRAIACAVQSRELWRRRQELIDKEKAEMARQDSAVEMQRRWHDREFSRLISEMAEDEWENVGDHFEKPFVPSSSPSSVGCEDEPEEGNCAQQVCILYFAKAREDPGYMGMAWAVTDAATGLVLFQQSKLLGLGVSAYSADYTALINGLAYARSAGVTNIVAHGDSALVANQVTGQWRARSPSQVKFLEQVKEHEKELDAFSVLHVPKAKNQYAINLARQAIEVHMEKLRINGHQIPVQSKEDEISEDCPICFERTSVVKMFSVRSCSHKFCRNCLSQHVEVQVKENLVPVRCPLECSDHLELDQCQQYLAPELVDAFARRLTEASIPEADRVYCPFKNCSALMSKGGLNLTSMGSSSSHPHISSIGRCECMECHRLFCVECHVPWHVDLSCADFQNLPPDERDPQDVKLHQLARNQNWQRCKKCKHVIELNTGCYHMTCKCGYEFCYICGAEWKDKQATCKCKLWDENNIIDDDDESDDDDSEAEYDSEPEDFPDGNIFYKTQICRHWRNANCWSGDACRFAHGEGELRRVGY